MKKIDITFIIQNNEINYSKFKPIIGGHIIKKLQEEIKSEERNKNPKIIQNLKNEIEDLKNRINKNEDEKTNKSEIIEIIKNIKLKLKI